PCVATDVGGVSEALNDEAGIVVMPRDPPALAAACLRLLRDADLRKSLGATARRRALEHFTVDRAVNAFDEIYTFMGAGYRILPSSGTGDELDPTITATDLDKRDERPVRRGKRAATGPSRRTPPHGLRIGGGPA
ncbi:MAG: glycosyltransferase, partial [Trebonia sp.]